jgi:hypothetical protein
MTISTDSIRYYGRNRRGKSVSGELAENVDLGAWAAFCLEQRWQALSIMHNGRTVAGITADKTTGALSWWAAKEQT